MTVPALRFVGINKVNSVDYLNTIMACYSAGGVAVPIDASGKAPAGRSFVERLTPVPGGGWFDLKQTPIRNDAPAQVSFSSGTTGEPKAILLSHRALADVTDRLIEVMGIDGNIREYLGVPTTHSFGLARARVTAAAGGKLFLPEHGFNPKEFAGMLATGEVNALAAVPTLLRVLIANPDLIPEEIGRRLAWLEIGSQAMSAEEKQTIRRIFPAARIIQHYGLTEASRTTFLDLQMATDAELATVGKPIGRTEVRIDDAGLICVRGPHVADGILTTEGIVPIVDADGWLRTRDLGTMSADGFLTFNGRVDDLLNIGGIKVPAELFERRLGELLGPDAPEIAVSGRPDQLRGETVMIAHSRDIAIEHIFEHARTVAAGFGLGNADLTFVEVHHIPRTETGKVRRKALTQRHADAAKPAMGISGTESPVAARPSDRRVANEDNLARIWGDALNLTIVDREKSFFAMGGDSLSAINVVLAMDRAGFTKDQTEQVFRDRTITQIVGSATLDSGAAATESDGLAPAAATAPPLNDGSRNMNPPDIGFWALVAEDYRTHDSDPFSQGFLMLFIHRFGNWRMSIQPKLLRAPLTILYRFINKMSQILLGIKLDYVVLVGRRVKIEHFGGIIIGARRIGNDVVIRQNTTFGIISAKDMNAKPTIGDFVDLGAGAVIVGNITVGDNSVIGPNSVVFSNVPPNSIVMGVPGQVIGPNRRRNKSPAPADHA